MAIVYYLCNSPQTLFSFLKLVCILFSDIVISVILGLEMFSWAPRKRLLSSIMLCNTAPFTYNGSSSGSATGVAAAVTAAVIGAVYVPAAMFYEVEFLSSQCICDLAFEFFSGVLAS